MEQGKAKKTGRRVTFRLSDYERELLEAKAKEWGTSITGVIKLVLVKENVI